VISAPRVVSGSGVVSLIGRREQSAAPGRAGMQLVKGGAR
jgi:hypothetical protein